MEEHSVMFEVLLMDELSPLIEALDSQPVSHFSNEQVLESTDHINSCKPINRNDPSYTETLEFLCKLKARYSKGDASL